MDDEDPEQSGELAMGGPSIFSSFMKDLLEEARPLFDVGSRTLVPLYRVETAEGAVTVTFDLPCVEKDDVQLSCTESTLEVEASMRKPVTVSVGGIPEKRVLFESFRAHIGLPRPVRPEKATATFKNGLLRVRFPIAKRGSRVTIR